MFFPRGFYDDFPNGWAWVAADGPYNEHLVRDFGGMNLGLGFVTLVALLAGGRWLVRAAAGGALLFSVPHFAYHVRHLDAYDGADAAGNVVSLSSVVVVAIVVLVAEARAGAHERRDGPDAGRLREEVDERQPVAALPGIDELPRVRNPAGPQLTSPRASPRCPSTS